MRPRPVSAMTRRPALPFDTAIGYLMRSAWRSCWARAVQRRRVSTERQAAALLAAFMLVACQPLESLADAALQPGWTRLESTEPAMSIGIPPGWIREEDPAEMSVIEAHDGASDAGFGITAIHDAPTDPGEWRAWVYDSAPAGADGRPVELAVGEALHFRGDFGDQVFVRYPDGPLLHIAMNSSSGPLDPALVQQILASLRFRVP